MLESMYMALRTLVHSSSVGGGRRLCIECTYVPCIQTGKTAFQHAIQNNSHDCMRYLVLQCGVDPDEPNEVSGCESRAKII